MLVDVVGGVLFEYVVQFVDDYCMQESMWYGVLCYGDQLLELLVGFV